MVDQAAFYLKEEVNYIWANTWEAMVVELGRKLEWGEFKEDIRENFYPTHIKKEKYGEFSHFTMGNFLVDEYYKKFLIYTFYCPEEVNN